MADLTANSVPPSSFPALGVDVALHDGATVHVRPPHRDAVALQGCLAGPLRRRGATSASSSAGVDLERAGRDLARPDIGLGLIATTGYGERIVGHGTYHPRARTGPQEPRSRALRRNDWQQHGPATTMLENHRMLGVFRRSGFAVEVHPAGGGDAVTLTTAPTREGTLRFSRRKRDAAVAALTHVLRPPRCWSSAHRADTGPSAGRSCTASSTAATPADWRR